MKNPLLPLAQNGRKMNNTVLVPPHPGGNSALRDPGTLQVQITEFLCPDSSWKEGRGHPPVLDRDRGDSTCQGTDMVSNTQQSAQFKNGSHAAIRPITPDPFSQKQSKCALKENGERRTLPYQDI